ncbi:MAG: hypothetical protein KC502_15550 [Myxococcales bacterium]|nr:hypothetical protein [Myxococcales bacterium]
MAELTITAPLRVKAYKPVPAEISAAAPIKLEVEVAASCRYEFRGSAKGEAKLSLDGFGAIEDKNRD